MDIKDIQPKQQSVNSPTLKDSQRKQVRLESLPQLSVSTAGNEPVSLNLAKHAKTAADRESRTHANEVITLTNLVAEAADDISQLMKSIGGIVEQARDENVTPQRREILENEANELVNAIKERAESTGNGKVRPLAGDEIRLEVEEKLGRTLEFILPDDAKQGFGLNRIAFTTRDSIINTVAAVEEAQYRIERLREAVSGAVEGVKGAVTELEIAIRNTEAMGTTVEDVDQAAILAEQTKIGIAQNPESALESVGELRVKSLELLE